MFLDLGFCLNVWTPFMCLWAVRYCNTEADFLFFSSDDFFLVLYVRGLWAFYSGFCDIFLRLWSLSISVMCFKELYFSLSFFFSLKRSNLSCIMMICLAGRSWGVRRSIRKLSLYWEAQLEPTELTYCKLFNSPGDQGQVHVLTWW